MFFRLLSIVRLYFKLIVYLEQNRKLEINQSNNKKLQKIRD